MPALAARAPPPSIPNPMPPTTRTAPAMASPESASTAPRVLVSDPLNEVALEHLRERGLAVEVATGLAPEDLAARLADVDALLVRSGTKVTRELIEAGPKLRVIGRAGIGIDNVDCEAATERGIVVMNTPTGNATTTAEHALALLFSLARHIPRADARVRGGSWGKKGLMGVELTGKTLGIVGLGRIGRLVAERALGLKMRVVAYDPYFLGGDSPLPGVEVLALNELLEQVDFLTVHVPLTKGTKHLLSDEEFARIKPGARLIDAARGGVVDEEAVLDALAEGRLAGAAFDVLEQEPPSAEHPLLGRDDVIVTPHLGASSSEAQHRVALDIAKQVSDFLLDGIAANTINAPALPVDVLRAHAPYVLLAERLGSFLGQRMGEPVRKVELTFSGELAGNEVRHLELAVLVGLLRPDLGGNVNFVNAPHLAEERGLRVLVSREESSYFAGGALKVRASTRGGGSSHLVSGAVFGREPRIVRVDDVHLDLAPRGTLLLTRHRDVPGVIGQLGTQLGERGVNVRRLELGSGAEGELAHGFLELDEEPPEELVEALLAIEAIEEVHLLRL